MDRKDILEKLRGYLRSAEQGCSHGDPVMAADARYRAVLLSGVIEALKQNEPKKTGTRNSK